MKTVYLVRDYVGKKSSNGYIFLVDEHNIPLFGCNTVELGWRNNERRISCVPAGVYPLILEYSDRFKMDLWELKNVPNRSECKIHSANYAHQLNGCIAPGYYRADLDNDGIVDVGKSKAALKDFHKHMGNDKQARIIIINKQV